MSGESAFPFLADVSPSGTGLGQQNDAPGASTPDYTQYLQALQVALDNLNKTVQAGQAAKIHVDLHELSSVRY